MKKSKLKTLIGVILVIYIICYFYFEIKFLEMTIKGILNITTFLTTTFSFIVSTILLIGLYCALNRIDEIKKILFNKKIIKDTDFIEIEREINVGRNELNAVKKDINEVAKELNLVEGNSAERDSINVPKSDECPMCFHHINKSDKVCSYCGYNLKNKDKK